MSNALKCGYCGARTPELKRCHASCCVGQPRGGMCIDCYETHARAADIIDRFSNDLAADDPDAIDVLVALVTSDFGFAELRRWRAAYVAGQWRPPG